MLAGNGEQCRLTLSKHSLRPNQHSVLNSHFLATHASPRSLHWLTSMSHHHCFFGTEAFIGHQNHADWVSYILAYSTLKSSRGNRPRTCSSFHGVPKVDGAVATYVMCQEFPSAHSFWMEEMIQASIWKRHPLNEGK